MNHERLLLENEPVLLHARRHPIVIAGPIALAVVGIVVALVLGTVITPGTTRDLLDLFLGIGAIFLTARALLRVLVWRVQQVIVTDRRLIRISGIVTRKVGVIPFSRVTDLTYRRGALGRLLGYGEISIESAGATRGHYRLDHLPHPAAFHRAFTQHIRVRAPFETPLEPVSYEDDVDTGPLPRVIV